MCGSVFTYNLGRDIPRAVRTYMENSAVNNLGLEDSYVAAQNLNAVATALSQDAQKEPGIFRNMLDRRYLLVKIRGKVCVVDFRSSAVASQSLFVCERRILFRSSAVLEKSARVKVKRFEESDTRKRQHPLRTRPL